MNKRVTVALVALALSFNALSQTADRIPSPRVWFRADSTAPSGTGWKDVSPYGHHATTTNVNEEPTFTSLFNYNPAALFDGQDDYLKVPYSLEGLSVFTIMAVYQSADTTERGVWGTEQGTSRNALLTTRRALGPDTVADRYGIYERVPALNVILQNWDKTNLAGTGALLALGSAGKTKSYKPYKGALAEFLLFDRSLTFLERMQYETYLAIKYGTGHREGNFVSSAKMVLWDTEKYAAYGHHLAGIGRDDYFGLYQKQSGSGYDSSFMQMSLAAMAISNSANTGAWDDQHFIVWGSNAQPLTTRHGPGPDSVLAITQRRWLATVTGAKANRQPTELYIDMSRLANHSLGYWLVIDRSGQGNFSVNNLEYVKADRIVNGKAVYKVMWDTDGNGRDNFAFARARSLLAVVRTLASPSCTNITAGRVSVEVVAGKAPYKVNMSSPQAKVTRSWQQSGKTYEQKGLAEGTYSLTIRDDSGETQGRNFALLMADALHLELGPDHQMTEGKTIVLDVTGQVPDSIAVSYRWENSFGFEAVDVKKIVVPEPGVYRVTVTKAKDGCVFTDEVAVSGAGEDRIAVFPVPVRQGKPFKIGISLQEIGSVNIQILAGNGALLREVSDTGMSEYEFDATLDEAGLYVVVVKTPKTTQTYKVIVN